MIKAYMTCGKDDKSYLLEIKGHATDEHTSVPDRIVCAAVSTLAYTLAQNLKITAEASGKFDYKYRIKDGYAKISAKTGDNLAASNAFGYTYNGLLLLAHNYPNMIEVKRLDV